MRERKRKRLIFVLGTEVFCLIILVLFFVSLGKSGIKTVKSDVDNIPSTTQESVNNKVISITPALTNTTLPNAELTNIPEKQAGTKEPVIPDESDTVSNIADNTGTASNTGDDTTVSDTANNTGAASNTADNTTASNTADNTGAVSDNIDEEFIAALSAAQPGKTLISEGAVDLVFYMQTDDRWGSLFYGGTDTIAKYACGPTSMAIVVSSLTDIKIDPSQMSKWAFENGYWYPESGSLHSVIPETAKAFGLQSEGLENTSKAGKKIIEALTEGKLVVALMGPGQFTKGGHFIVLRGIDADGKIILADCNSEERTNKAWDIETITSEAKSWASDGGPFWIIWK